MGCYIVKNFLVLAITNLIGNFGLHKEALGKSYGDSILGAVVVVVCEVCKLFSEILSIILKSDDSGNFLFDLLCIGILKEGDVLFCH